MADSIISSTCTFPTLQKMFKHDSSTLSLRYLKDTKTVEGLADFLDRDVVRVLKVVEPAHASIFIYILEEIARVRNRIEVLHIDLWSNGAPELVNLLGNAFRANSESLLEISLKCRFGARFVADVLPLVPNNIEILDLSENILSDTVFLEPLMDLIKCSEIRILRLMNCSMRSDVLDQFVTRLNSSQAPISLDAIEGVDLSACEEIPKNVRNHLKDPPAKTRKDQMGYNCIGPPPQREAAVQYLDYLKSSLLMHRLEGCRVRIWWPATSDENRSAFAGRFWPAKVLRVNPIDMIFVVEYDNQEVDHVPCKFVQPDSPFSYGGGLNPNFLRSLFGTNYYTTLSDELSSRPSQVSLTSQGRSNNDTMSSLMHSSVDPMNPLCQAMDPCEPSYYCGTAPSGPWPMQMGNGMPNVTSAPLVGSRSTSGPSTATSEPNIPGSLSSLRSAIGHKRTPTGPTVSGDRGAGSQSHSKAYQSDSIISLGVYSSGDRSGNTGFATSSDAGVHTGHSRGQKAGSGANGPISKRGRHVESYSPPPAKEYEFITTMLEELTMASRRRGCDIYLPRDLSHLVGDCAINVETLAGLDITLSGNVLQVGDVCEFRDPLDSDGSDPSDYIGVIQAINSKEPIYKVMCVYQDDEDMVDLDSNDVRRLSLIPWYFWVSLVMSVERHALLSKRLIEPQVLQTIMSECLLCAKKRDANKPFKDTPPNPLEMPLESITDYATGVKKFPSSHPRLASFYQQRNGDSDSIECLRFQLRKQQQKLNALLELYEAVRVELEKERDLNVELQAKLNCVICFEKRINCLLNPCGHFNFCSVCAESFSSCPICRRKIMRRQVLSVD